MKKPLKIGIGVAVISIVLMIAAIAAVPVFFDPNDHKDFIVAKVEQKTGRTLSITGNIQLTYYPWLGIEIGGITLGNAPGFGDRPFFHADQVAARVKVMPLLKKQIEMDTIRFYGAEINLAKNAEGLTNWDDLAGSKTDQKEAEKPQPLAALALGGVDIRDASMTWHDQSTETLYTISNLAIATGKLSFGEPIDLTLSFKADSNKPKLTADVSAEGTIAYRLDNEHYTLKPLELAARVKGDKIPDGQADVTLTAAVDADMKKEQIGLSDFNLEALGTKVSGYLTARNFKSAKPAVAGEIVVKGKDLAQLFQAAEIEPMATTLSKLKEQRFDVAVKFDSDLELGNIEVPRLSANLLGAVIEGMVSAENIHSKTPKLKGSFHARGKDLPTVLQMAGQIKGGKQSRLEEFGRNLAGVPGKAFDFSTDVDANLKTGNIDVSGLSVKTLGVFVAGGLKAVDMTGPNGRVDGKLSIKGRKLSTLLAALGQRPAAEVLRSVDVDAHINGSRTDLRLRPMSLTAVLAGKAIRGSPVEMALKADARANLEKETLTLSHLVFRGAGLNVKGNLNGTNVLAKPRFDGNISVAPFNLRKVMQQFNQKPPPTADKKVLRKVALKTTFSGSKTGVKLKDISFQLDDTHMTGTVSVANFKTPDIRFGLTVDKFNADRYLPPKEKVKKRVKKKKRIAAKRTSPAGGGTSETAMLPLDTLRSLKTKGEIGIGKLILNKLQLSNVRINLDAREGQIRLNPVAADLYQGTHAGDIFLNAAGKIPKLTLNASLKNIAAEPLLNDLTRKAKLRGTGDFSASLTTTGLDVIAMKKGLNGQMSFSFRNGALIGYDIGKFLRRINSFKQNLSFDVSNQEETDFTELNGHPQVSNGIVSLDDLDGKSPALRFGGKGVLADLITESIDYLAKVTIVATSKGQGGLGLSELDGVTIPIRIRGALSAPKIEPDISGIIASKAQNELEKQVLKKLGIEKDDAPKEGSTEDAIEDAVKKTLDGILKNKLKLPF